MEEAGLLQRRRSGVRVPVRPPIVSNTDDALGLCNVKDCGKSFVFVDTKWIGGKLMLFLFAQNRQ
jgi:hypothetical protein